MDPFIIKVFLSLMIGVIWVVLSTNIAERVSGEIGGLIIGLPSTAVSSGLYCFYFK